MAKGKHSIVIELGNDNKEVTSTNSYGQAMTVTERMAEDNYSLERNTLDNEIPVISFNGKRRSIHIVSSNNIEEID